ncbi:hypothetical protein ACTFIW_004287 [Dictyostelium discoideum]
METNINVILYQDLPCFLLFTSLHLFLPKIIEIIFKKNNIEFDERKRIEWPNRIISTINAIVTSSLSIYCLYYNEWIVNSLRSTSEMSYFIFKFITYYFIYDFIISSYYSKYLFTWGNLLHHTIALLSFTFLGGKGLAHHLLLSYTFTEITTPLINLRFFLLDLNLKNHPLYLINGLLVFVGFVLFRVFYTSATMFDVVFNQPHYSIETDPLIPFFINFVYPAITLLNLYWTFYISKSIFKYFTTSKNENSNNNIKNKQD